MLRRIGRSTSFSGNVTANYLGRAWEAAMSIAFVPAYIHFLGVEAYGVIGLVAVIQSLLLILDFGMTPTLARESARYEAGEHPIQHLRDLVRSIEVFILVIALSVVALLAAGAPLIASYWVRASALTPSLIADALTFGGILLAVRLFESIYRGTLLGLGRQVLCNVLAAIFATLRAVGALFLLAFHDIGLDGFMIWQVIASLLAAGAMAAAVYLALPAADRGGRFSAAALRSIGGFAGGVLLITLVALAAAQADKVLLSRILSLDAFGHYMFAFNVALVLEFVALPIVTAVQPRLVALAGSGDRQTLSSLFHRTARTICLLTAAPAALLVGFAPAIILLWSGNAELAGNTAPLLAIFALGTFVRSQCVLPYYLQLSHGWTSLTVWAYLVTLGVTVAALIALVPAFGAVGGAWIWSAAMAIYFFALPIMFRRLLPGEAARFYLLDIALIAGAAFGGMAAARALTAGFPQSPAGLLAALAVAGALTFGAGGLAWVAGRRLGPAEPA